MLLDRWCLPEFFQLTNAWRETPHYSILIFFGNSTSHSKHAAGLSGSASAAAGWSSAFGAEEKLEAPGTQKQPRQ